RQVSRRLSSFRRRGMGCRVPALRGRGWRPVSRPALAASLPVAAPEYAPLLAQHDELARVLNDGQVEHGTRDREVADTGDYFLDVVLIPQDFDMVAKVLDPGRIGVGH